MAIKRAGVNQIAPAILNRRNMMALTPSKTDPNRRKELERQRKERSEHQEREKRISHGSC